MFSIRTISLGFLATTLFTLVFLTSFNARAQKSIKDSTIAIHLIEAHFSLQVPGGDIADRFGTNSMVGAGYLYKTSGNWLLGAEGGFLFGSNIKDSDKILDNIETEDGNIVDLGGIYATYHYNERGILMLGKVGKVFTLNKPNINSGIAAGIGAGFLQHKILIEHRDKTAPQITGDYTKGYDELKRGPALNVFLGYLYLSNNRIINFYAGAEMTVAFTENVHPYSFNKMEFNTGKFTDMLYSVKIGWFIPVYRRAPKDFYYY